MKRSNRGRINEKGNKVPTFPVALPPYAENRRELERERAPWPQFPAISIFKSLLLLPLRQGRALRFSPSRGGSDGSSPLR